MSEFSSYSWEVLRGKIGLEGANKELDERIKDIYNKLHDITSVSSNLTLFKKLQELKPLWLPAIDQYERTVLHLVALNGNTKLACALVNAGALINEKDGIGQSALTLALHKEHHNTARKLIECGASVNEIFYKNTIAPIEIARVKDNNTLVTQIENKLKGGQEIISKVGSLFKACANSKESVAEKKASCQKHSRFLDNIGDQKNTTTIQSCANRCPDVYGCHTPGGGDFHNRAYINESVARIAGQGGFWYTAEHVLKRPTVNPTSFGKNKFKENNYNNNEEALLDYKDGVSIAMIKAFEATEFFPTEYELEDCLHRTLSHKDILLKKFSEWNSTSCLEEEQFHYHSNIVNELIPITRWYKESVRYGNGIAIEGVWMLCPALYCAVGKTNYKDEAFTHVVNSIAKWPIAYRKMYQQNRTINLDGSKGRQLAGDEWVEEYLVRPVKQYASAQSSFAMVELMSCSTNLLEMNREMYKNCEAFDVHRMSKHKTPQSVYDQLKVAQFATKENWFSNEGRKHVIKYQWGDKQFEAGATVVPKYIRAYQNGCQKAEKEFPGFLQHKFPSDML